MVKFTGRTDEAPLLSNSSSNVSLDETRHNLQGSSSGENKGGLIRLFSRNRPITPMKKPLTTKTRKTVDTRTLVVEKDPQRKPGSVPTSKRTKKNLRPQPLQENKKDSRRKQRILNNAARNIKVLNDPPNMNVGITAVISQGDSTTGCSHTVATTQSDTGGNELRTFHSLGGSTSRDDHEDCSFPASFDGAENGEKLQVQHVSPLSSTRSSRKSLAKDKFQNSLVSRSSDNLANSQQTASICDKESECPHFIMTPQHSARESGNNEEVELAITGEASIASAVSSSVRRDADQDFVSAEKRSNEDSVSSFEKEKPTITLHKKINPTPKIVATVSKSPVNDTLHVPVGQSSQPNVPARPKRPLSKTKALLARPFGRSSLPPEIIRKWVVEVSPAEWDADESQWKYRLLIQSRHVSSNKERKKNSVFPFQQSFTTAFTWRSIADFFWLAESLQHEYQGGLLLPDLSRALRGPIKGNIRETPIEAEILRNWLSDVLNGVRGQGELVMDHEAEGILGSESMEAFLYRSSGPTSLSGGPDPKSPTGLHSPDSSNGKGTPATSFIDHIFSPSAMLSPFAVCTGSSFGVHGDTSTIRRAGLRKRIDAISCQSSALVVDRSFDRQDSFFGGESVIRECPTLYSMFIETEQDLTLNFLSTANRTTEKLHKLIDEEEKAGYAWSVFIQSLAMLFAFEKEFESAHIAELKLRPENMPYCSLAENAIDDSLESFTKAKVDRALPSLNAFGAMLRAFVDDLESIEPSCSAFNDTRTEIMNKIGVPDRPTPQTWEGKIKDLASRSFGSHETEEKKLELQLQKEVEKNRLLKNEKLLYRSLTTFCRGVPIRSSRMAWRYLNTEAIQCAALRSASVTLRRNVAVNEKSVAKMISRQLQHERQAFEAESSLVKQILDLTPTGSTSHEAERILKIAQDRGGKWDLKLAKILLKEIGITDSDIQLEELPRELETIRKYACGLRENLDRCIGSLNQLRKACVSGRHLNKSRGSLETARDEFLRELANLLSGTFVNVDKRYAEQRKGVLCQAGIDTTDPFKWNSLCSSSQQNGRATFTQGSAANLINAYFIERDSRTEWTLDQMSQLLQEYSKRVDAAEGFIYMIYVGLEVEGFFKSKRAETLVAFEKKTDVKTAINIAMKKRLPQLVSELQVKLDGFGPDVSQTKMKEIKAAHLASKEIKSGLHELATKRLILSREASTERVTSLIEFLSKEAENASTRELKALGEAMAALEKSVDKEDFETVVYKLSKTSLNSEMI